MKKKVELEAAAKDTELSTLLRAVIEQHVESQSGASEKIPSAQNPDGPPDSSDLDQRIKELKAAKLKEEVRWLHLRNVRMEKGLPIGVKHALAMERDNAEGGGFEILWCSNCRVTVETPEELDSHKSMGHLLREIQPGELYEKPPGRTVSKDFDGVRTR